MSVNPLQAAWPLKKPQQLVYVELGSGNGGMMLGVCQLGFTFRAVAPLRDQGPVPFSFAPDGKARLEGVGELAWMEDDGKAGGLKFTNVTPEFRDALRVWLAGEAMPKSVGREVTPAASLPYDSFEKLKSQIRERNTEEIKGVAPKPEVQELFLPNKPSDAKPAEPDLAEKKPPEPKLPELELREAKPPEIGPLPAKLVEIEATRAGTNVPEAIPARTEPAQAEIVEATQVEVRPFEAKPVDDKPVESKPVETKPIEATPDDLAPPLPKFVLPSAPVPASRHEAGAAQTEAPAAPLITEPPVFPATPAPEVQKEYPPLPGLHQPYAHVLPEEQEVEDSPRLNRAAATTIIAVALAIILVALLLSFRREVGETLIRLGEKLAGEDRTATVVHQRAESNPPTEPAKSAATPTITNSAPPETRTAETPSKAHSADPSPNSSSPNSVFPNSPAPVSAASTSTQPAKVQRIDDLPAPIDGGSGQKEFEQARTMLKGSHRQRDLSSAVNLLWTAVRKGYVPAEVTLADLYARGDGVERSCEQARVLLEAAVQKGSPEGRRRLYLLTRQGCS